MPRFEEALLVLHADGKAFLVLGNENYNKAEKARISASAICLSHFSLPDQPMQTKKSVSQILGQICIKDKKTIGLAGWKKFTSSVEFISAFPPGISFEPGCICSAVFTMFRFVGVGFCSLVFLFFFSFGF